MNHEYILQLILPAIMLYELLMAAITASSAWLFHQRPSPRLSEKMTEVSTRTKTAAAAGIFYALGWVAQWFTSMF